MTTRGGPEHAAIDRVAVFVRRMCPRALPADIPCNSERPIILMVCTANAETPGACISRLHFSASFAQRHVQAFERNIPTKFSKGGDRGSAVTNTTKFSPHQNVFPIIAWLVTFLPCDDGGEGQSHLFRFSTGKKHVIDGQLRPGLSGVASYAV